MDLGVESMVWSACDRGESLAVTSMAPRPKLGERLFSSVPWVH